MYMTIKCRFLQMWSFVMKKRQRKMFQLNALEVLLLRYSVTTCVNYGI